MTRERGGAMRIEDDHLLVGASRFTVSAGPPDRQHAVFVRSDVASARIVRIDLDAARRAPGVVAAYDGRQLAGLHHGMQGFGGRIQPEYPVVATDRVRFAGEALAVVVARTEAAARDAVALVDVDLERLPVVVDARAALAPDAPLVHDDVPGNVAFATDRRPTDLSERLAECDVVVRRVLRHRRVSPAALEPRCVVVAPEGERLTVWSSTQIPHLTRTMLARGLGVPTISLRVVAHDVGGAFGGKLFNPEELAVACLARDLGAPVGWVATRSEDLVTTMHSRVLEQQVTLGADRDGTFRVLDVELLSDVGAYVGSVGPGVALGGAEMTPGAYVIPVVGFAAVGVHTNLTPVGAYRGAGRPEATYAIERIVDEMSRRLGVDPVELRRRNLIPADSFPYENGAGLTYDSGRYELALDRALDLVGYDRLRAEQETRRSVQDPVQLGVGLSTYVEVCGSGSKIDADDVETMTARLRADGDVEVVVGSAAYGQGHVTTWTGLVADRLDLPASRVHVLTGDTDLAPDGFDSYGSRTVPVLGPALVQSTDDLARALTRLAAAALEAEADDLELRGGAVRVKGDPSMAVPFEELSRLASSDLGRSLGLPERLAHPCGTDLDILTFPSGAHVAVVEVDTETGGVRLRDYVAVDDVGTVLDPTLVDGQIHGGAAQGIAQALFEEVCYDEDGHLVTPSLSDYGFPSASDLVSIRTDRTVTPTPATPPRGQGSGRGRCHRLDAGGGQRCAGRSRAARSRDDRHADDAVARAHRDRRRGRRRNGGGTPAATMERGRAGSRGARRRWGSHRLTVSSRLTTSASERRRRRRPVTRRASLPGARAASRRPVHARSPGHALLTSRSRHPGHGWLDTHADGRTGGAPPCDCG